MYRISNSQEVASIRHCMDEELNTLYVLEYNKHEYITYATFMVTSDNFLLFPNTYD